MRTLLGILLALTASPVWAAHAYSQFGEIKYPKGFKHFEWVNPDAPKGGEIELVAPLRITNFDKYNPYTLKGTSPPGIGILFETLLTGTMDEPTTAYGLLAEDIEVAPDGMSATFRLNPAARFHDGTPVLAADVKHSFDTLLGPFTSPAYKTILADVAGLDVLGERTVRFRFKLPNRELPLTVGAIPIFSRQ
jgi:microcin C transport system substrate-binding protein